MTKKLIVGLTLATMLPFAASAATVDELQAQITALMAQLTAAKPVQNACSFVFTKTLKQGMSDAEVMNLQKVLNADVATQVASMGAGSAGNETMYFGAATKAALVRYQDKYASDILVPAGLSKGTGLFGAATRAHINKCAAGTMPTTGTMPTVPTAPTGLSGGAGTLTVTNYTSDVEDIVVTGSTEIVDSFKGKAEGSDVRVSHVKLTLTAASSSLSTYLSRYFTSFDVYADGKKVGSADVGDFSRDSSGLYTKTIALTDTIVKMGSSNQIVFTIKANAAASIDTENIPQDWTVKASDVRYQDATGVILTASGTAEKTGVSVQKLASSSDVKVKISSASTNPDEKTVFVSDSASGDKVSMNEFKIKAEGTKISFDTLKVTFATTTGGTAKLLSEFVTELQLVRGDSVIDTLDPLTEVSGLTATFNLDTQEVVNQDETVTYKIVARMQKIGTGTFAQGDKLSVSFLSINPEDKNGDSTASKVTGSSTGKAQTFRATGINLAKVTSSAVAVSQTTAGAKGYGQFTFDIKITASGDDLWVPLTASTTAGATTTGIIFSTGTGTTTAVVTRVSGGTDDSSSGSSKVKIADGETATIRLTSSFDPTSAGFAKLVITKVNYTLSNTAGSAYSSISATPTTEFETASIDIRP